MQFCISDRGHGFPPQVLDDLQNCPDECYSGLFNVHRRLVSVYGASGGLHIRSTPEGSEVSFEIPLVPPVTDRKEKVYAHRG
jgi:two-component system sensor histidine kinase LytS